ncbi:MAG: hypothetical protein JO325_17280 [Solirubrobacterales bacterium]|nr:hypothetical protein [Solirubrobacterales bacterium]
MTLYPELPNRRNATIARDIGVCVALVVFALLAGLVYSSTQDLKVIGEAMVTVGSKIPGLGQGVANAGLRTESRVHHLAVTLAAVTFFLPAVLLLWWYAPRRLEQIRRLSAASRVLAGAPERELAIRAAVSLPYAQLLAWTDDPLGDLAAERYDGLLAAAFDDLGLRWPVSRGRPRS